MSLLASVREAAGALRPGPAPSVVLGLLAGVLAVLQAALLARAVDGAFVRAAGVWEVAPLLVAFVLLAIARAAMTGGQEVFARRFSSAVRLRLRRLAVRRILSGGPVPLASERSGEVVQTLMGGIEALDPWLAQYVPQRLLAVLVPLLILLATSMVDPLSGLVLVVTGPLVPFFAWLVAASAHARASRQWGYLQALAARFLEAVQGLETLRATGRLGSEHGRVEEAGEAHRLATMDLLRLALLSAFVLELVGTLGTAVVAVELGLRLLRGGVAFGDALFVLILAPEFYRPMRTLGAAFHSALSGQESARRVLDLIWSHEGAAFRSGMAPEEGTNADQPGRVLAKRGLRDRGATDDGESRAAPSLVFDGVCFAYGSDDPPALRDFTLSIGSGETVALVGPSGAGKSTVVSLLLRFCEPSGGSVLVDGRPLALEPPESWRRRVAWVPQRPHLFRGTLGANLRLASPEAQDEELEEALGVVGLFEWFRRLPAGLATPLGEGGEGLSGGEAQRLAVARAVLRRSADLLVFDEPTAHLDPHNELVLVSAFDRLRRGRTALLVAHRLTTALEADLVVVMSGGRVVESGAPSELVRGEGVFAGLVSAWRGAA